MGYQSDSEMAFWYILALAVVATVNAGNEDCSYPFEYGGNTYTEGLCANGYFCKNAEGRYVYDCKFNATQAIPNAAVSDIPTNVEGQNCTFPFHYNGIVYDDCIGAGSNPWCSLTVDYNADRKRGTCKKPCHYPFIYNRETYTEGQCVQGRWCATTANYDEDHQMSYDCKVEINGVVSDVKTTGGNGEEANCVFPFMYGGRLYEECMGRGNTWCAVTENYDQDHKWGYCVEEEEVEEVEEDAVEEVEVVEDEAD